MPEIVLTVVIVALLAERVLAQRGWDSERGSLLNRLLAETPGELIALEREPRKPRKRTRDDDGEPQVLIGGI